MKQILTAILLGLGLYALAETPTITNVTARQRYPWNGKVDISYTVLGNIEEELEIRGLMQPTLQITATDRKTGDTYPASSVSGDTGLSSGTHSVVWDMNADGLTFESDEVVFDVSYEAILPAYCIIDLSGGTRVTSYPVSFLTTPPEDGFNTDEYKTTKLVLRLLDPGPLCSRQATITKPFYIGLFEVTQKQYGLVMNSYPSYFYGDTRPVEKVSYNVIRGSSLGSQWPASSAVDADSFLGKLRARTGLEFDLPTEAQWEYACQAGSSSSGSSSDPKFYMWYKDNSNSQTHAVGLKQPNAWGLYDMYGNVCEWCLDWYGGSISGNDPVGPSSGDRRVARGGSWDEYAEFCTSSQRFVWDSSYVINDWGFRLARNPANE